MPKERIRVSDLEISDAHVFAKNFKGNEKRHNGKLVNAEGKRGFCVEIDPSIAQDLKNDGWNVTIRVNQDDGSMFCYIPVEVRYRPVRPLIYTITRSTKKELDEDQIHQLDQREFTNVNLVLHPHWWFDDDTEEWRIKAFLAEGWFYIRQSRFAEEWENRQIGDEE